MDDSNDMDDIATTVSNGLNIFNTVSDSVIGRFLSLWKNIRMILRYEFMSENDGKQNEERTFLTLDELSLDLEVPNNNTLELDELSLDLEVLDNELSLDLEICLPQDVVYLLISFLDVPDVIMLSAVSKYYYEMNLILNIRSLSLIKYSSFPLDKINGSMDEICMECTGIYKRTAERIYEHLELDRNILGFVNTIFSIAQEHLKDDTKYIKIRGILTKQHKILEILTKINIRKLVVYRYDFTDLSLISSLKHLELKDMKLEGLSSRCWDDTLNTNPLMNVVNFANRYLNPRIDPYGASLEYNSKMDICRLLPINLEILDISDYSFEMNINLIGLTRMTNLRKLVPCNNMLSSNIPFIPPTICELSLPEGYSLSIECLTSFSTLTNLRTLHLGDNDAQNLDLEILKNIESLYVEDGNISHELLLNLTNLRTLHLRPGSQDWINILTETLPDTIQGLMKFKCVMSGKSEVDNENIVEQLLRLIV